MSQPKPELLFDRIAALANARPFTVAGVAPIVELTFQLAADSNVSFSIYRSTMGGGAGVFASAEVRAPTPRSPGKDGMVIANVAPELCVKRADVPSRFGKAAPHEIDIPRPGAPKDLPEYERYFQPWGSLKLGFSRTSGCLTTVILDTP